MLLRECSSELALRRVCALHCPGFVKPFHSGTRVEGVPFILESTYQVYISQFLFCKVLFLYLNNFFSVKLLSACLLHC